MATLQEQINAASSGAVLTLPDNSEYVGNFVINKALSIAGNAKIRTPNADPALLVTKGSGAVSLAGLDAARPLQICTTSGWPEVGDIVRYGEYTISAIADLPAGLKMNYVSIFGQPGQKIQRGLAANGLNVDIANTRISEIHYGAPGAAADSQAIGVWNSPGPFKIYDSYLEAAGENIMFGGALPSIQGVIPSDIDMKRCRFVKPTAWMGVYAVKNLFELKNARRVSVDGCQFENCWVDAQAGYAILFTVRSEDGAAPWTTLEDVSFTNNTIKNVPAGFQLIGLDVKPSQQGSRLRIANNLIQFGAGLGFNGRLVQMQQFNGVTFENNEANPPHSHLVMSGQDSSGLPLLNQGLVYRNNLLTFGDYGVFCDGDAPYTTYAPDGLISNNYIYGPNIPAARKLPGNSYFDSRPTTIPTGIGVDTVALTAAQSAPSTQPPATSAPTPAPKYSYSSTVAPKADADMLKLLNTNGVQGVRPVLVWNSRVYFEKAG